MSKVAAITGRGIGVRLGRLGSHRAARSGVVVLCLALVVLGWFGPSAAWAAPHEKQLICHATSAVSNPYVQNTVDVDSIIKDNGHGSRAGPVFPTDGWGDIIPPFDYTGSNGQPAHYPGLNWTPEGTAIFQAACDVELEQPPTESPSPTPTPPSSSPTASDSSSATDSSPTASDSSPTAS